MPFNICKALSPWIMTPNELESRHQTSSKISLNFFFNLRINTSEKLRKLCLTSRFQWHHWAWFRENESFSKTILVCLSETQVGFDSLKKYAKEYCDRDPAYCDTVPLGSDKEIRLSFLISGWKKYTRIYCILELELNFSPELMH